MNTSTTETTPAVRAWTLNTHRRTLITLVLIGWAAQAAGEPAVKLAPDAYARAESFLPFNLTGKVRNASVVPQWLDGGERFWYRRETQTGHEVVLVESATGKRLPAPDATKLEKADPAPPAAGLLVSPDGTRAVFVRDFDLWLRELASGEERRLTHDGEAYFAYGKLPDLSFSTIPRRHAGVVLPPNAVEWSPDSCRLIVARLDERGLGSYPLLESVPVAGGARPVVHELRIALPGDRNQPKTHRSLIDVVDAQQRSFELPEGRDYQIVNGMGWSGDRRYYYFCGTNGRNEAGCFELDATTAAVRPVLIETNASFIFLNNTVYSAPNVRLLAGTNELVWFSERDGWGHLYLYEVRSGALKNRITRGDWLVRDIMHVDEKRRLIYFTAGGREPGRNPYYRHLYRVGFDGRGLQLLTPEDADHELTQPLPEALARILGDDSDVVSVSPDGRYFVDTWSTVDRPPVSVLRSTDGRLIATLETADATALYAMGWQPPEPFVAKAADGVTDLYGMLYKPTRFDRNLKYPVIEHLYGGPQTTVTPRTFMEAVMSRNLYAQRELGFVMVVMDVRGTVQRSKAFQDYLYRNFADWMIEDHVAVLKQLGARHAFMDLDRVGVQGHSFGGYGSARALLARPDFYKVAVSSAGSHNLQGMYPIEAFVGPAVYSDGSAVNPNGIEIPINLKNADNATLAPRLRGKLLLAYGDLDENAYPAVTLQFADALIKANKSFDLVYLPNRTHDFSRDVYFVRRTWDYFVEHLLGAEPPDNYSIKAPPPVERRPAPR